MKCASVECCLKFLASLHHRTGVVKSPKQEQHLQNQFRVMQRRGAFYNVSSANLLQLSYAYGMFWWPHMSLFNHLCDFICMKSEKDQIRLGCNPIMARICSGTLKRFIRGGTVWITKTRYTKMILQEKSRKKNQKGWKPKRLSKN